MTNPASRFEAAEERYLSATPTSRALYERARGILPNGIGRAGVSFLHYPIFIERAEGKNLYDADGRAILDMWNGASSYACGHTFAPVIEAVQAQVTRGLGYGAMSRHEVDLALLLRERVPSMERIRFTASGSEATMFAIRLARAFTGRTMFARMAGSYHGLHDMMCSGEGASLGGTWLGLNEDPVSAGVLPHVRESVIFLPFNDLDACRRQIEKHAEDLATIVVEPFLGTGGGIPADIEFLRGLRKLCDAHGILLTFDEMISIGMAPGGAQEYYGIKADLTATGKLIGGGMPIGAFGGRADIMAMLEPVDGVPPVLHTGTWAGHQLAMTAGLAQMRALDADAYRYLGRIGEYARTGIKSLAKDMKVAVQVTGIQQFLALHYTDRPIRTYADTRHGNVALGRRVAFSLLSQGFFMFGGRSNLSTVIGEADIDRFIGALGTAFYEADGAP